MAAPTQQELSLLADFRKQISDLSLPPERSTDMELLRWIRARENKLDRAEDMLRKSEIWRKETNIDSIQSWTLPPGLEFPSDLLSYDKDNCPVLIRPYWKYDLGAIAADPNTSEIFIKHSIQLLETVASNMRGKVTRDGTPVSQFLAIMDFQGVTLRSLLSVSTIKMLSEYSRQFEANYPEFLKKTVGINAGKVITTLFTMMKPFVSQKTIDKFQFYGEDPNKWVPALRELVDVGQLPAFLGGARKDSPLNEVYFPA